jgi:hypothetical protein
MSRRTARWTLVASLCGLAGTGCGSPDRDLEVDAGYGPDGAGPTDTGGGGADAGRSPDGAGSADAGGDAEGGALASGGAWVWQSNAPNDGDGLLAVWTDAPGDAWAVGAITSLHWDGIAWHSVPPGHSESESPVMGVWGSGPNDVWAAVGDLVHWDGSAWTLAQIGTNSNPVGLSGVWGTAQDDVWAVGGSTVVGQTTIDGGTPPLFPVGIIEHFDGKTWTVNGQSYLSEPVAVWGSSASDLWAVGGEIYGNSLTTTVLHFEGSTWDPVSPNEAPNGLMGVWASSPLQAWAVGAGAMVVWNGSTWTPSADARLTGLRGVWGSAANDVWVVGYTGALHWDGATWSSYSTDGAPLNAVGGVDRAHVWAVGQHGAILAFDPTSGPTPTCAQIGGQCVIATACGVGAGHVSGHACGSNVDVCCVASSACLGPEPPCCDAAGNPVPDRPQCNGANYACVNGSVICPPHP